MLSRLSLAAFVFPIVLLVLDHDSISIWLFLLILNRIRDLFDFGYIDNFSRNYSYLSGVSASGKIKSLLKYSNSVYVKSSIICFLMLNLIGFLGLYVKGFDFYQYRSYYFSVMAVSVSGALFIYGNRYVSFLFGLDKIQEIKRWDTVFTIMNICSLLIAIYKSPSVFMLTVTNSIWVALTVMRNFFLFRRYTREINKVVEEKIEHGGIKRNARREFIASLFSLGYNQTFNLSISLFLPISISNVYLFLDNVVEQIKNLSRVPFYVKRPRIARVIRRDGFVDCNEISRYVFQSHLVLFLGLISFFILGDYILGMIKSSILIDKKIWLSLSIYAAVERFSSIHNQLNIILSDAVKTHFYLMITCIVSMISTLVFLALDVNYYFYPLTFVIGHVIYYSWHVAKSNYALMGVTFMDFERKFIVMNLCLLLLMIYLGV